jgi:hypothetical protein
MSSLKPEEYRTQPSPLAFNPIQACCAVPKVCVAPESSKHKSTPKINLKILAAYLKWFMLLIFLI